MRSFVNAMREKIVLLKSFTSNVWSNRRYALLFVCEVLNLENKFPLRAAKI